MSFQSMSGHLRFRYNLTQKKSKHDNVLGQMMVKYGKMMLNILNIIKPWDSDGFCTF